jgi:predicted dehydrogenase
MKGALLGFGAVCEKAHVPAFQREPGFEIVAVADTDPARRAAAARCFPGIRGYATPQALLEEEEGLDFVDIATPPHLHAEQSLLALERRVHVLCEKPLVLRPQDLEALRRESRARRRAVFPVHNWKHAPLLEKLHDLVAGKAVGTARHVEWHVLRAQPSVVVGKGNWRTDRLLSGGGVLMDHGWHAFYLLGWILGKEPSRAWGVLGFPHAAHKGARVSDSEDEATCLIEYPKATAVAHFTWRSPTRGHWGVVYGSGGTILVQDDRLIVVRDGCPEQTYVFPEPLSKGSAHPEWFQGTLRDFKAATEDLSLAEASLDEAGHCLRLLEQVYRQARPTEAECRQAA